MNAYLDEQEPEAVHAPDCKIWTTDDQPCDCKPTSPDIRRLTTAQRLDQLRPDLETRDAS